MIEIPYTLKEWTASNTKQCKVKDWLLNILAYHFTAASRQNQHSASECEFQKSTKM
jgi:hypothetical protein